MILLDEKNYGLATDCLREVNINNLFARAVVERRVKGKVMVDDTQKPGTFYVEHPYGMALLFGNHGNETFNNQFLDFSLNADKSRNRHLWLQAFPGEWTDTLKNLYRDTMITSENNTQHNDSKIIELNTRINFKFEREKYLENKPERLPSGVEIKRTDESLFKKMSGSVVPSSFWDTPEDFLKIGAGFSLFYNGELASTSYSAFVHDNMLELGIETIPEFRGKGLAQLACSALIDYCLENNYEPVWACKLENTGSYKLAQKLGFKVSKEIPYYRLSD